MQEMGHKLNADDNVYFRNLLKDCSKDVRNTLLRTMLEEQIKAATCHLNAMKWNPEILKWAAHLRYKLSAAYDAINDSGVLRLPSRSTLDRLVFEFKHPPGFHHYIPEDVRKQSKMCELLHHQKCVSLVIHEMSIRSDIVYKKHTGDFVGFTDLGKFNKEADLLM